MPQDSCCAQGGCSSSGAVAHTLEPHVCPLFVLPSSTQALARALVSLRRAEAQREAASQRAAAASQRALLAERQLSAASADGLQAGERLAQWQVRGCGDNVVEAVSAAYPWTAHPWAAGTLHRPCAAASRGAGGRSGSRCSPGGGRRAGGRGGGASGSCTHGGTRCGCRGPAPGVGSTGAGTAAAAAGP
jgi:hypothetical protein